MPQLVIFLDDGGVMNDNELRGMQWRRMVGEYFIPLLGGTSEAWSEANYMVSTRMFEADRWSLRLQAAADFASFDRAYQIDWLQGMCEIVGVACPPEEECIELGRRAAAAIISRVRAAFPGAVDATRTLHSQGYTLHTASGEPSSDLAGYLDGMEVRHCFGTLYGPDLIDTFKQGPEYYERIFAHAGIAPSNALVVDDSPRVLSWAAQVGARTVLVHKNALAAGATLQISSLAELPEIISSHAWET
jgi:HAD superfamily hydrolase (TIGR01509 family)